MCMCKKILTYWMVCLAIALSGCGTSPKKIIYLQDMQLLGKQPIEKVHEAVIQPGDLLAITVSCMNPELAAPFNLQQGAVSESQSMLGYQVDANGDITFPILGRLHVEGLTRIQLTDMIKERIQKENLIKDPTVTMQFLNFKISMLGEVNAPGTYQVQGERITLLEAISMAGDLTITGRRDRVAVIRESDGERTILFHDLTSVDLFKSPCYYLQQNDIVYVEPNKAKAGSSNQAQVSRITIVTGILSMLISVATLIVSLTR